MRLIRCTNSTEFPAYKEGELLNYTLFSNKTTKYSIVSNYVLYVYEERK